MPITIIGPIVRRHIEVLEKKLEIGFLTTEWSDEMRKGVFITGLTAVTIIAASLSATPASACHHPLLWCWLWKLWRRLWISHLAYYGGGYGYRRYGWYGRRHWRAWG